MPSEVLLVEDNPADIRLVQEAFRNLDSSIHLHLAADGIEAMSFLNREGKHAQAPRPDLILMDLNLPKMGGREALALIKMDDLLKAIPVVIVSGSVTDADIPPSDQTRANSYVRKPEDWDAFDNLIKSIGAFWLTGAPNAAA
jgi:two-component system, chemotaxis family, response regulator Rcp1